MASLSSVTRDYARVGQGGIIMVVEGIFPASAATADVAVGELLAKDSVNVYMKDAVASDTIPMIETRTDRTTGTQGKVVIGTQDKSSMAASGYVVVEIKRLVI